MAQSKQYVQPDQHGAIRVGAAGVLLDGLLAAWEQGHSPETIQVQYPSLTLEEVYGTITWCLSHPDEVIAYAKRQDALWASARAEAEAQPDPLRDRLRALNAAERQGRKAS